MVRAKVKGFFNRFECVFSAAIGFAIGWDRFFDEIVLIVPFFHVTFFYGKVIDWQDPNNPTTVSNAKPVDPKTIVKDMIDAIDKLEGKRKAQPLEE